MAPAVGWAGQTSESFVAVLRCKEVSQKKMAGKNILGRAGGCVDGARAEALREQRTQHLQGEKCGYNG